MHNEKFLQEPSNNEIHREEILFSDEKKLQRYLPLKSGNDFTESDSQIQIMLATSIEDDEKTYTHLMLPVLLKVLFLIFISIHLQEFIAILFSDSSVVVYKSVRKHGCMSLGSCPGCSVCSA